MLENIALYARVSTEEQAQKHSIDAQLDHLRTYANSNGYKISKEYVDPGYSGMMIQRPAYRALIEDAIKGKFTKIIVYKLDRLFRSTRHLLNLVHELEDYGVSVCSATEPFDTGTPVGRFTMQLFASVAELERNMFIQRSEMGRLKRLKKGFVWGSHPPYGYNYNRSEGKLEINKREAKVVRRIFDLYCRVDMSASKVANKLNRLGDKTRKGKEWRPDGISTILRRHAYMGKHAYNKMTKDPKVFKSEQEWIWVKVPAIVSKNTFTKVQQLIDERRSRPLGSKFKYLLNGKLFCGYCGNPMRGVRYQCPKRLKSVKRYYQYIYYTCGSKYKKSESLSLTCRMKQVSVERLDAVVWTQISDILASPEILLDAIRKQKSQQDDSSIDKQISALSCKIKDVDSKRQAVITLYRERIIQKIDLKRQLENMEIIKEGLVEDKAKLELLVESRERDEMTITSFGELCSTMKDRIGSLEFAKRREIIDLIVNKIVVQADGVVEIHFALPANIGKALGPVKAAVATIETVFTKKKEQEKHLHKKSKGGMFERSGGFTSEMYEMIIKNARRYKVTSAEMIRRMVSFVAQHDLVRMDEYRRSVMEKADLNKGFTDKRKSIHFTLEQVEFLENMVTLLNVPMTEAIRICVRKYCEVDRADESSM